MIDPLNAPHFTTARRDALALSAAAQAETKRRNEEAARADREAREKLAAEEHAAQAAITQAAQAETLHPAVAADLGALVREQHAEAVAGMDAQQVIGTARRATVVPIAAPAARTSVPTLRIGVIKDRLQHMSVTAEDLRALGFEPAGRERAAPLYHEDDEWTTDADRRQFEVQRDALWAALKDEVLALADDGSIRAYDAARDFRCDEVPGFNLEDCWEWDCRVFKFDFLWNCYAIAWGIKAYDKAKQPATTT